MKITARTKSKKRTENFFENLSLALILCIGLGTEKGTKEESEYFDYFQCDMDNNKMEEIELSYFICQAKTAVLKGLYLYPLIKKLIESI